MKKEKALEFLISRNPCFSRNYYLKNSTFVNLFSETVYENLTQHKGNPENSLCI